MNELNKSFLLRTVYYNGRINSGRGKILKLVSTLLLTPSELRTLKWEPYKPVVLPSWPHLHSTVVSLHSLKTQGTARSETSRVGAAVPFSLCSAHVSTSLGHFFR